MADFFCDKLEPHVRTWFRTDTLDHAFLQDLKKPPPGNLRMERISKTHLDEPDNLVDHWIISHTYKSRDFLADLGGFCVVDSDSQTIVGFCCGEAPVDEARVDLSIRVADDEKYRRKGLATQLCIAFIEDCLAKGITPDWDAATPISAELAIKLGYVKREDWNIYHVQTLQEKRVNN